ncbi:MAG: NAD(P) transhydrogenase subunit alpha [Bacilli bacterium]
MDIIYLITIFALAVFLGVELITKVPSTLHTPLMSGTNAISGITIVGAIGLLMVSSESEPLSLLTMIFAGLAVFLATLNVVGGFVVTNRMLNKFKGKKTND